MTTRVRYLVPGASVLLIALVNWAALTIGGGGDARLVLLTCGIAAVVVALQSAAWDPESLGLALLLSVPPLFALVGSEVGRWLIGPLGALLLVACELNVVGWRLRERSSLAAGLRARLVNVGVLGTAGVAASVAVAAVGMGSVLSAAFALIAAAAALVMLARVLVTRG